MSETAVAERDEARFRLSKLAQAARLLHTEYCRDEARPRPWEINAKLLVWKRLEGELEAAEKHLGDAMKAGGE